MDRDVVLNKVQVIERCIRRINEEYQDDQQNLLDFTKQDSIVLNIQRACEGCIDLAMHIVSENKMGIPQSSREAFDLLEQNNFIAKKLANRLKAMVGFRNIAIHDYQNISLDILQKIIEQHLGDFTDFTGEIIKCL
ncbi:MAG: DUF86 domain-containing protein [Desulfotomaculum sp.]|nr:DUF86 domain-containing protein [Desulfotomaculum sp.]MCL0081012.1 DUF86 domain-containing protein [Peptococcaceae bacterium]